MGMVLGKSRHYATFDIFKQDELSGLAQKPQLRFMIIMTKLDATRAPE
jgi:hypothetical protein